MPHHLDFAVAILALVLSPAAPQDLPANLPPGPAEIHVDGRCRIFTQDRPDPKHPYSKPRFRYDPSICHFESENTSDRWEYKVSQGVVRRTYVVVREREYLLSNPTAEPVLFVVDQFLPKGWVVDSDPPPAEIANSTATFRVIAQPGQTVRLHTGEKLLS